MLITAFGHLNWAIIGRLPSLFVTQFSSALWSIPFIVGLSLPQSPVIAPIHRLFNQRSIGAPPFTEWATVQAIANLRPIARHLFILGLYPVYHFIEWARHFFKEPLPLGSVLFRQLLTAHFFICYGLSIRSWVAALERGQTLSASGFSDTATLLSRESNPSSAYYLFALTRSALAFPTAPFRRCDLVAAAGYAPAGDSL